MKSQDNRVLGRTGARELTPREMEHITGAAVHTLTACTNVNLQGGGFDGDAGECSLPPN